MNAKTKNPFLMVICYCLCVAKLHHGEMSYFFVGIDVKCSLIEVCALPTVKSLWVEHSMYGPFGQSNRKEIDECIPLHKRS